MNSYDGQLLVVDKQKKKPLDGLFLASLEGLAEGWFKTNHNRIWM
jgi:hypothetical protein